MHFDGDVGAVEHRGQGLLAVPFDAAAVAADDDVVHDEGPAGTVVDAADVGVAPVREGAHGAVRQGLGKGAVDGVEDADLQDRPTAARRRETGVEERAFPRGRTDRPHATGILRTKCIAIDLQGEDAVGAGVVHVGVDGRRDLIAAAGIVDLDFVALEADVDGDPDRRRPRTVIVEPVLEAVDAVRNLGQRLAQPRLRTVENFVVGLFDRRLAMVPEELLQAFGSAEVGLVLGPEVALHLFRHADVAQDRPHQVFVEPAFAHQANRQDAEALLECLGHAVHLL